VGILQHGQHVIGEAVGGLRSVLGERRDRPGLAEHADDQVDQVAAQLKHHAAGILRQPPSLKTRRVAESLLAAARA